MRVVFAGGATGGHVFVAVAVAQEIQLQCPQADILFVGSRRQLGSRAVTSAGFASYSLSVSGLVGKSFFQRALAVVQAAKAVWESARLLRRFRADVVLGVGGYASGPTLLAAWLLGIPTAVCEPNSVPGLTNRLLGFFSRRIYGGFAETVQGFSARCAKRFVFTGIPVRAALRDIHCPKSTPHMKTFRILVLGGSQGASALNESVPGALYALKQQGIDVKVLHQSGEGHEHLVQQAYLRHQLFAEVVPFIQNMADAYAQSDLIIARCGAGTCAEITQVGAVAVLVPLPCVAGDHQRHNASCLAKQGAALLLPQSQLSAENLACELMKLTCSHQRRQRMQQTAACLAHPQAAAHIAQDLLCVAKQYSKQKGFIQAPRNLHHNVPTAPHVNR
ncbi:MAG: undecaprenyldiphospho-muramoylpentapeptide beta-N-acetylglucosaminyltransferase [Myxococcota bacterium]